MTPQPVQMTVEWRVRPQQGRGVLSALQTLMNRTRCEPGCVSCSLETDVGEHLTLKLREEWQTEQDMERYVRSGQFVSLAILIESAKECPSLQFELPTGTRGLDWAEEIRGQNGPDKWPVTTPVGPR